MTRLKIIPLPIQKALEIILRSKMLSALAQKAGMEPKEQARQRKKLWLYLIYHRQ